MSNRDYERGLEGLPPALLGNDADYERGYLDQKRNENLAAKIVEKRREGSATSASDSSSGSWDPVVVATTLGAIIGAAIGFVSGAADGYNESGIGAALVYGLLYAVLVAFMVAMLFGLVVYAFMWAVVLAPIVLVIWLIYTLWDYKP